MTALLGYERFSLHLDERGNRVQVHLRSDRSPDARHEFLLPAELRLLAARLESADGARQIRAGTVSAAILSDSEVARLGKEVFDALFGGEIGRSFERARERARQDGKGIALRLHLDPRGALAALPWEVLHDGTEFLAECAHTPILRIAADGDDDGETPRARRVLRLLVVAASPVGAPPLDLDGEIARLERALAGLSTRYGLEVLAHATLEQLARRLRDGPVDIFHFLGHGAIEKGEAVLYLEHAESGAAKPLSGEKLASLLVPASSSRDRTKRPRLVVLNACDSARSAGPDPWQGVAQSLLRKGIPRVLAMQAAIPDAQAVRFAESFYGALAADASPERALAVARRALRLAGDDLSWLLPVLHVSRRFEEVGRRERGRWGVEIAAAAAVAIVVSVVGMRWMVPPVGRSRQAIPPSDVGCPSLPLLELSFRRVEADPAAGIPKSFCIARTETTRRQYRSLMAAQTAGGTTTGSREATDELPRVDLSPEEERRFFERLRRVFPGYRFRLPEAVEWRYAARAGRAPSSVSSAERARGHELTNCKSGFPSDGFDGLAPVASFPPNEWGLFDVVGNASESVAGEAPPGKRLRLGSSFDSKGTGCGIESGGPVSIKTKDGKTGLRVVAEVVVDEKASSRDASDPQR